MQIGFGNEQNNFARQCVLIFCTFVSNVIVQSSLVRQRAAQWKEKEALGGRLPIPVPQPKE